MVKKLTSFTVGFTFLITMMLILTPFKTVHADENDNWMNNYIGLYVPVDSKGYYNFDWDEVRIYKKGDSAWILVYPVGTDGSSHCFSTYIPLETFKAAVMSGESISFEDENVWDIWKITISDINGDSLTYSISLSHDGGLYDMPQYTRYRTTVHWFSQG